MIKINKDTKPKILEDNAKQWTDEYLTALKQSTPVPPHIKYRYQHKLSFQASLYQQKL